jgi:hypothetical protein
MELVDKENIKDSLNLLINILLAKKTYDKDHDIKKFFDTLDRRVREYDYIANTTRIQQLIETLK